MLMTFSTLAAMTDEDIENLILNFKANASTVPETTSYDDVDIETITFPSIEALEKYIAENNNDVTREDFLAQAFWRLQDKYWAADATTQAEYNKACEQASAEFEHMTDEQKLMLFVQS